MSTQRLVPALERQADWDMDDVSDFRALARAFIAKEVTPHEDRFRQQHCVDRELWNRAGEAGLLLPAVEEKYGGGGGTFAHDAALTEELARAGDFAWCVGIHNAVVGNYIAELGTEEQKQVWLPRMATGEVIGAIGMSEPGAGSDLAGLRTRAVRDGDDYIINGSKTFISNGQQAGLVLLAVKTDPDRGAKGVSLFLVDASTAGFRRGRVLDKVGQHGQDTSELFFEDMRVPANSILGLDPNRGFGQMMQQLPNERLTIAITAMGVMESALVETLLYTRDRNAFGKPLIDFQNTRFKLAEAAMDVRVTRSFVDECIERAVKGTLDINSAAMAKCWATERGMQVVDDCLQLHGGYGYMGEYRISRMWTDLRVLRIYGGTTEIMKEVISRSL